MSINRRVFLTQSVGGAATTAGVSVLAGDAQAFTLARPTRELLPDAVGILYDSTLCIGCNMCVAACRAANGMPAAVRKPGASEDLDGQTLTIIKTYANGTRKTKDSEIDGYAYLKRQCLHCVDPTCVSVCPVGAMTKDSVTGIVTNNKDACMGCRYCSYACPYGVAQFDLTVSYGRINKCEMCVNRQKQGKIPACSEVCPTGATLFGRVADLQAEADRRLSMAPGTAYQFPRGKLSDDRKPKRAGRIAKYQNQIYGLKEGGGTQVRYLAGIPFQKLGLPKLPSYSFAAKSEGIQHTLYHWFAAPVVLFAGFLALAYRSTRNYSSAEPPNA